MDRGRGTFVCLGFSATRYGSSHGPRTFQRFPVGPFQKLPAVRSDDVLMYALIRRLGLRSPYERSVVYTTDAPKKHVLAVLRRTFAPEVRLCVVYAAGHGYYDPETKTPTGNWVLASAFDSADAVTHTIGLGDVLRVWHRSGARNGGARLVLITDVCFSGGWVDALQALQAEGRDLDVAVQASAQVDECAIDGLFTRLFVAKQHGQARGRWERSATQQHPVYVAPWGARGGRTDAVTLADGVVLRFYQHPRASTDHAALVARFRALYEGRVRVWHTLEEEPDARSTQHRTRGGLAEKQVCVVFPPGPYRNLARITLTTSDQRSLAHHCAMRARSRSKAASPSAGSQRSGAYTREAANDIQ